MTEIAAVDDSIERHLPETLADLKRLVAVPSIAACGKGMEDAEGRGRAGRAGWAVQRGRRLKTGCESCSQQR